MKQFKPALAAFAISTLLAACSSTPPANDTGAAKPAPATSSATPPAATPATTAPAPSAAVTLAHKDPNSLLSKERSVYFDYDDFSVKSQYNGLIERHGKYLQAHPELAVRIEGFADERGSAEYNLSLGQKRSESVMRAMKIYGVKESQMEAVSFGEERPKATGHDEAAWAQNRRADIAYRN